MKNTISIISALAIVFTLAFVAVSVEAEGKDSSKDNSVGIENQLKTQLSNQGEGMEIQVENKGQLEVGSGLKSNTQIDSNTKTNLNKNDDSKKDELDDDSDNDGIETVDSDDDGYGDDSDNRREKKDKDDDKDVKRSEHRSAVSVAVQAMLQIAEKHQGIGEQVRVIAQNQVKTQEEVEVKLANIEDRDKFTKFLIGPKYSDIKDAEKLLEQNRVQIRQLNQIKLEISNQSDVAVLDQQIQVLENVNLEIENSLKVSQEGFSLFGWLSKAFVK